MRRLIRIATRVAAAAAAVALAVWAFLPGPVEVDVAAATRGDLVVTVDHEGKTRVKERYVVSSPLSGRLLRVELRPGDPVTADETLLAAIEPADPDLLDVRARAVAEARVATAKAAVEQAGSDLDRAKVLLDEAQEELERVRRLHARQATTEREYETAAFREQVAGTNVRSAKFALRVAEFEAEQAEAALLLTRPGPPASGGAESHRFEIAAPVSGVVLRVFQESSTIVTPGTPLLEVGDPAELECEVDVLSTDAVKVDPGQRVVLEYWGGDRPLEGRVRVREPAAFTKISALGVEEQRVNIVIDLVDPPAERPTLGDGYRVEARIVVWEGRDVVKVPAGALFRRGDEWVVFRVEGGRARLRPVEAGRSDGLETQVLRGLAAGDRVILHPTDRVEDGSRVEARTGGSGG